MNAPQASVIIPAYNEGSTIERCLEAMLADADPGELEVVVVCNGCSDDTASRARRFESRGVKVVETSVASKSNALNLGDDSTTVFPRFYIDADIQVSCRAIREVVQLLASSPHVLLSAPSAIVNYQASDPWVKAYYRVWTRLPYFTESMVGSGIYAFSQSGRERFVKFPAIIADDEYARRVVKPEERKTTRGETFTISAPRTVKALLNVNTRVRAGMYQLDEQFPELVQNRGTDPGRTLRILFKSPQLWMDAPIYLGIMFLAKLRAHKKLRGLEAQSWNRDETARQA